MKLIIGALLWGLLCAVLIGGVPGLLASLAGGVVLGITAANLELEKKDNENNESR